MIIRGDSLSELKKLENESVDCCITSPPYFSLRIYLNKDHPDYNKQIGLEATYQDYIAKMLLITAEIKRVLKKTGSFWLNMGDCYYGSGHGGSSKFDKGLINFKDPKFGKGRNDCPTKKWDYSKYNPKCLLMIPERLVLKMIDEQGWILRNKIKWVKQIYIHKERRTIGSVMPTSVKDRFNESGEELYFFVKSKKYYADLDSVRLPIQTFENRPMGVERQDFYDGSKYNKFNYRVRDAKKKLTQCPQFKATEEEIKKYQGKFAGKEDAELFNSPRARTQRKDCYIASAEEKKETGLSYQKKWNNIQGKNLPSCWLIGTEPHNFSKEYHMNIDHFATFPQGLVEIPIKFSTPKGGIVLDPFAGSGTTCVVAKKLGRNYIGIELNPEYIAIANKRISEVLL